MNVCTYKYFDKVKNRIAYNHIILAEMHHSDLFIENHNTMLKITMTLKIRL